MKNDILLKVLLEYIEDIKEAKSFMIEKFGDIHFLRAKNRREIPSKLENITNSSIKSYHIHGRGCCFRKKNYYFDIEFDLETSAFGFTEWTTSQYFKNRLNKKIIQNDIKSIITELQKKISLRCDENIYFYE